MLAQRVLGIDSLNDELVEGTPNSIELSMDRIKNFIIWVQKSISGKAKSQYECSEERRTQNGVHDKTPTKNTELFTKPEFNPQISAEIRGLLDLQNFEPNTGGYQIEKLQNFWGEKVLNHFFFRAPKEGPYEI